MQALLGNPVLLPLRPRYRGIFPPVGEALRGIIWRLYGRSGPFQSGYPALAHDYSVLCISILEFGSYELRVGGPGDFDRAVAAGAPGSPGLAVGVFAGISQKNRVRSESRLLVSEHHGVHSFGSGRDRNACGEEEGVGRDWNAGGEEEGVGLFGPNGETNKVLNGYLL